MKSTHPDAPDRGTDRIRKRVWVQNVAVQARLLEARLHVATADPKRRADAEELRKGVQRLLRAATDAAYRDNPIPTRWQIWWRGTLIEAAYQNLHAAEALISGLYSDAEVEAEAPEAVARVEAGLSRDDPRRAQAHSLLAMPPGPLKRERLRKTIEVGYAASDRQHSMLRSFRNLVLGAAAAIGFFVGLFVLIIWTHPTWVPLCFTPPGAAQVCPTGSGAGPSSSDVVVVALLGLLGGALAGAVSIRNIKGTATPYEVHTALALLKVPFGAMTALGALIAIRGDFVPGLSELDSQVQILAYALAFGYAQQLLTGLIDRQAESLLQTLPSKDSAARPELPVELPVEGAKLAETQSTISMPAQSPPLAGNPKPT